MTQRGKEGIWGLIQLWLMWILASLTYFHQYYLRQIISNLAPYLRHDFFLSVIDLSDLAAIFFIAYIITLPIAGILLDRFGMKTIFPITTALLALSCFIFAESKNEVGLIIARILMGASATFSLLGAFTIIRRYFRAELFPLLSSLTLSIGLLGGVFGGWFLVKASKTHDWRILMHHAGWFALGLALFLFLNLITYNPKKSKKKIASQSPKKFLLDLKIFLATWRNWIPGFYAGFILVPIVAFAGFWSIPLLMIYYHFDRVHSGQYTSLIFIGYAIGAPIIALLGQKAGIRLMMILSASIAVLVLIFITHFQLPFLFLLACLFFLGFTAGAFSLTTIQIKLTSPAEITGSAFSFNTMLAQLVGALILWLMGLYVVYKNGVKLVQNNLVYSPMVLEETMHLLIISAIIAIILAFFIQPTDSVPSN